VARSETKTMTLFPSVKTVGSPRSPLLLLPLLLLEAAALVGLDVQGQVLPYLMNPAAICSITLLQLKIPPSNLARHVHQVGLCSILAHQIIVDFPPAIDGGDMKRSLAGARPQVWIHLVLGQEAFKKSSVIVLDCPVDQAESGVVADSLRHLWVYLQLRLKLTLVIPRDSQKPSHLSLAPFSLSSGEAANRPMRLKWFPLLRRRRAHPPPILAPEQKPLLAPWRAEPQNRKWTESGRPLGQVCTILQIQVKCLLSLLVVIAIWMKVGQICFPFIRLKISLCWNLNLSTCVCQPLILNIRRLLLLVFC